MGGKKERGRGGGGEGGRKDGDKEGFGSARMVQKIGMIVNVPILRQENP